jgi:hypothetical protein
VNRLFFAPLFLAGALFLARTTAAADPVVVAVLVSPSTRATLAARVQAELASLGFATKEIAVDEGADTASLEAAAKTSGAAAAIRVVRSDKRAEVWVVDRVTGKTLLRTVTCGPDENATNVLAVRAVELLRASLLEVEANHPSRGDVAVTATVRRVVAETHPAAPPRAPPRPEAPPPFAAGVGFAADVLPSLSPAFEAQVALAWMPSRLGVEIFGTIPLSSSQVCNDAGCAFVTAAMFGGGLRWVPTSRSARVQPSLGAGFAGVVAHAEGRAAAPYSSATSDAAAAVAYAVVGFGVLLGSHVRIGLDVRAGAALPPVPIRFAGTQVAQWGGPFVATILRTDLAFP